MPDPVVSVLILTWISRDLAGDAVASALAQTYRPIEVIVCDNASDDGTPLEIARRFGPQARVVCFERNTGYTGCYNRALALARGEFLLLQNPDARLAPVPFESFGFYLDLGHDRTQDRPIDLEDARPIRTNERLGYGAIVKLGWRTDAELGVTRSTWRNVEENYRTGSGLTIGDVLDRDEDGTRMKLRYRMFGRTRLTLETLRKTYDFANETPRVAPDGKESRVVPGIDFGEGGRLSGTIRYGHASLDNEGTQTTDYSGRVGSANLAWNPGSRTTVLVETKRDAYYSVYEASRIYVQTSYDLRVIRYFNRALGAEIGWSPGKLTFPGDPRNREDRLNDADVGVRLRLSENALGRRIEYTLRLTRYDRNSVAS